MKKSLRGRIITKKIMALACMFTLTFSDFAFVGKAYGTALSNLLGNESKHENVIFDASFQDEKTIGKDFESDVNNNGLGIKFELDVEKAGYLKDAKIEILPKEGEKINFEIVKDIKDSGVETVVPQTTEEIKDKESIDEVIETLIPPIDEKTQDNSVENEIEKGEKETEETPSNIIEDSVHVEESDENKEQITNSLSLDMNEETEIVTNTDSEENQKLELTMGEEKSFNSSDSLSLSVDESLNESHEDLFNTEQTTKYVESMDENTINLKQIRATSSIEINLPIRFKNEKYIEKRILSSQTIVRLTGKYIDGDGKERQIEYNQELNLSWKDERLIKVGSEITKYIDYGNGIILQTKVKVNNQVENNTLPVKETEIKVKTSPLMDIYPSLVNVTANNLYATNGETYGNTSFGSENWNYEEDTHTINIHVENKEKEQNYYDESREGLKEQELSSRFYNGSGEDEYLITYIYNGISAADMRYTINNSIEAQMKIFSGSESENMVTDSIDEEVILEKTTGEIASLEVENMTESISKAYFYANYKELGTYDLSISAKYVMNIANKELVDNLYFEDVQNFYIDKSGNNVPNDDLSYKEIVVNKANFDDILGLDGEIKIFDANDKKVEYGKINKDTVVDTNGDMSLFVQGKIDRIRFEISKPVNEGNLVVTTTKGLGNLSISKEELQNMGSILTRTDFNVKYSGIEEELNLGTKNTLTELLDTRTKADLIIEKNRLSTLSLNENVDIKIELNNDEAISDLFGHSVFEIEYPSYIDSINILNTSLLYGEGLDIAYVSNQDRKITVVVDGIQKELNSGILTNGTNIVITTNINANVYAPAIDEAFKMTYINDEATEYFEGGMTETYITYLSPSGVVSVNTIKNYKDNSNFITSVKQGTRSDLLNIYQEQKNASMEILVMNNDEKDIEGISLLGRFPHVGMKDILTSEDMGNTRDIEIMNISPDINNNGEFDIFYSSVEEATDDLNDINNRWTDNFDSVVNPKSYLIVPKDSEYTLLKSDIIKFSYDFIIPADMGHGEKIVGTFVTNYKGESEGMIEKSYPDIVYLDTENGPELEIEVDSEDEAYENSELYTSVFVRNKGTYVAKNITIIVPIPSNTEYVSYYSGNEKDISVTQKENELAINVAVLKENSDITFDVIYRIGSLNDFPQNNNEIELNASIEATDLGSVIKANPKTIKINKSELIIRETFIDDGNSEICKEGSLIPINIVVSNISDHRIENASIEKQIPEGLQLIDITRFVNGEFEEVQGNMFDGNLKINIGDIEAGNSQTLRGTYKIENLRDAMIKNTIKTKSTMVVDGKEYESNEVIIDIARPEIELVQETDSNNTYIKENDIVNYKITIKNKGEVEATGLSFEDTIPAGLSIISYSYNMDGIQKEITGTTNDKIFEYIHIGANQEIVFNVVAKAQSNIESLEKSVTNVAKVNSYEQGVVSSNSITHIIEKQENEVVSTENESTDEIPEYNDSDNEINPEVEHVEEQNVSLGSDISTPKLIEQAPEKKEIERTYKISGYIWEDRNQDGIRTNGEGKIDDYQDMTIRLVNAETGIIEDITNPDEIGYYVFQGVRKGNHYIILNYNTRKYGITTYKKDGASEIVNSDIIASKVQENGILINTAITDKIKIDNKSISNIDMGLFYADKFDLEIDSTITQVMVQTSRGMETTNFNYEKLAKVEIAPNDLDGAIVYVEYTMKISNKGDVAGYAKKIVDYISKDMVFNSGLEANKKWFTGTDGNIYTNELINAELKPGESREIKLVLQKKMTEENTGLVNNQVEIIDDYNIYGISDIDSIAGNNVQAEDDMSISDVIITLETGEKIIYTMIIVLVIAGIVTGGYALQTKMLGKEKSTTMKKNRKKKESGEKEE